MSDDAKEKVLGFIIRTILGAVSTGGSWTLLSGAWFGKRILRSFADSLGFSVQGVPELHDSLYQRWSGDSFLGSFQDFFSPRTVMLFLLLMAVLAHVLFKAYLPRGQDGTGQGSRAARFYSRWYFFITMGLLLVLTTLYFAVSGRLLLVTLFLLVVVPGLVYLLYYYKDTVRGGFLERFSYIYYGTFVAIVLVGWPAAYGRNAFDIELYALSGEGAARSKATCEQQQGLSDGGAYLVDEKDQIFCSVCTDGKNVKMVKFEKSKDPLKASHRRARLREMQEEFQPFEKASPDQVTRTLKKIAEASGK